MKVKSLIEGGAESICRRRNGTNQVKWSTGEMGGGGNNHLMRFTGEKLKMFVREMVAKMGCWRGLSR